MHTRYATLDDGALRALLPSDDVEVLMEVCNRFIARAADDDYEAQIRALENKLWNLENESEIDHVEFAEYDDVCNKRDDLQLQVDTLTATFDALVNT